MAMDKILEKIKRGHFLVDEWCNVHSKYDVLSLREELYAEAMTMGMERLNCVITLNSEVKTIGGGLTEQEQREQKNMFEVLSRLDNWLSFDGSNNDLQIKGKEETSTPIKKVNVITKATKKYFDRAVAKGYAEENNGAYIWKNKKVMLGYFVYKVYYQDVTDVIPYKAVEELFGVPRLDSTIYGMNSAKKEQKWKWEMDKEIFFD